MADRDLISQFDGVRALAFMAVFLHHGLHVPLLWTGVDQFFVLSGFLITRNLLQLRDESTRGSALSAFYYRRVLRIIPPYYVALVAVMLVQTVACSELPWFCGFASHVRDALHTSIEGPLSSM